MLRGEQQRLRFALALLPDPELLVLDEPTTGMDVEGRRDFWSAIRKDTERGRTVLFATHYLDEADAYADRIVLLNRGLIVADGTASEVKALAAGRTVGPPGRPPMSGRCGRCRARTPSSCAGTPSWCRPTTLMRWLATCSTPPQLATWRSPLGISKTPFWPWSPHLPTLPAPRSSPSPTPRPPICKEARDDHRPRTSARHRRAGRRPDPAPRSTAARGFSLTFLGLEMRRLLRNRRTVLFTLVLPVVFLLFFGTNQSYSAERVGSGNVEAFVMISMAV